MSSNVAVVALKLVIVFEKSFLLVAIEAGIVKFVFKSLPNSLDVAIKTAGWPSNPVLVPIILISLNVLNFELFKYNAPALLDFALEFIISRLLT